MSRGEASLGEFLLEVYKQGGKIGAYKSALKKFNLNIDKSVNGYGIEEIQPWDFIESYPRKELLLNEKKRLSKNI